MAGTIESISTLNSFIRTILVLVALGGASVGGWFGYNTYFAAKIEAEKKDRELAEVRKEIQAKEEEIARLGEENEKLNKEVEKLDTFLRLLKVDRRVARLSVLEQGRDPENANETYSLVEFVELDDQGAQIDKPKRFKIQGDMVYIEYKVVKFEDKYIQEADFDRSTSLCMFQRIFGEKQKPVDGFVLDEVGARPAVYGRGNEPSVFEAKIWSDFWNIANNPERARELGIRAIHDEAPSIRVQNGKSYKVELRASGGLSITPDADLPKPIKPAT